MTVSTLFLGHGASLPRLFCCHSGQQPSVLQPCMRPAIQCHPDTNELARLCSPGLRAQTVCFRYQAWIRTAASDQPAIHSEASKTDNQAQ